MKTTILSVVFASGLLAQDATDAANKHVAEMKVKAMVGMAGQTFEFVGGQLLGGSPVKGQPYSAEAVTQTTQTLADGSHILNTSSSMLYRDTEGRERREESIGKLGAWNAEGGPAKMVFISDPVAQVSYTLDAASHTAHKMAVPANVGMVKSGRRVAVNSGFSTTTTSGGAGGTAVGGPMVYFETRVMGGGEKSSEKVEKLDAQMIEGVQAEGTRTTVTIPAGQIGNERDINIVNERWYSAELQVLVMSRHSDPRMGETVYKLANINRTEPLHSMFEVPAGYTISEPKERMVTVTTGKEQEQQ